MAEGLPDLEALIAENGGRTLPVGEGIIDVCAAADAVFLALHGDIGENGQLQALLDINGISYPGSGFCGSSVALDKDIAKRLMRSAGILTPDWIRVDSDNAPDVSAIVEELGLPVVVKPCSCGSSVGVVIVNTAEELDAAIREAARYEKYVMVEKKL